MDLLIKIAYIALGLDILIILTLLIVFIRFVYIDIKTDEKINEFTANLEKNELDKITNTCKKLMNSRRKTDQYTKHFGLALLNIKNKEFEPALDNLEKAREIYPDLSTSYYKTIDILFQQRQFNKAYSFLFKSIYHNILFDCKFFIYAGMLFISNESYDEAIKIFELAEKKDSSSPTPNIGIAIAHYLNKNNTLTIDSIRTARKKIKPQNTKHNELNEWAKGLLAIIHGDLKEAKYIFEYYKETSNFSPVFELILNRINNLLPAENKS